MLTRFCSLANLHRVGRVFTARRRKRQCVPLEVMREMVKGQIVAGLLLHRLPSWAHASSLLAVLVVSRKQRRQGERSLAGEDNEPVEPTRSARPTRVLPAVPVRADIQHG